MTTLVFVHGWGYDASIWDKLRARLAQPSETIDLGFFGAPSAVAPAPTISRHSEPVIAVGHSLGALWWLTQSGILWHKLLCINGFPRFTAAADYPGVAPRVLTRMRQQFAREPAAVLADFHARCGAPGPDGTADISRLAAGLGWLDEWDGRATLAARCNDIFALAGTDDPIVPRAMSAAAFSVLPTDHLEFAADSGHLLPLAAAGLCACWIEAHCL